MTSCLQPIALSQPSQGVSLSARTSHCFGERSGPRREGTPTGAESGSFKHWRVHRGNGGGVGLPSRLVAGFTPHLPPFGLLRGASRKVPPPVWVRCLSDRRLKRVGLRSHCRSLVPAGFFFANRVASANSLAAGFGTHPSGSPCLSQEPCGRDSKSITASPSELICRPEFGFLT